MSIRPVNNHILIEPVKSESFIPTDKGIYEEIGIVIDNGGQGIIQEGDKVYFDPWLAARYPTGKGDEFFWLVKWSDIRAIEDGNEIPK